MEPPASPGSSLRATLRSNSPKPLRATVQLRLGKAFEDLQQRQAERESAGRYDEAIEISAVLREHRADVERLLTRLLDKAQQAHLCEVDRRQEMELCGFLAAWDACIEDYEKHAAKIRATLEDHLLAERDDYTTRLGFRAEPRSPRHTPLYLDLRRIEASALRTQRYSEARAAKLEADRMQQRELEEWREKRRATIANLEAIFLQKQERERQCLEKRIAAAHEGLLKTKERELEVLLARGRSVRSELSQQQRLTAKAVALNPLVRSPFELVTVEEAAELQVKAAGA